jgi:hypothetical protein
MEDEGHGIPEGGLAHCTTRFLLLVKQLNSAATRLSRMSKIVAIDDRFGCLSFLCSDVLVSIRFDHRCCIVSNLTRLCCLQAFV